MRFKILLTVSVIATLMLLSGVASANPVVAVDPGHGGWDSGAVGPTGMREADVNLDIAVRLKTLLQGGAYGVIMTRESDIALGTDLIGDLSGRVDIANNAGADIFVSIHNNSFSNPSAGGIETYYYKNSSGYYNPDSKLLAEFIQQSVVDRVNRYNRGAKGANFYVLRNTNMVAVLSEGLFISNPTEEAMLADPNVRQAIAQGIYDGIGNYFITVGFIKTGVWSSKSSGSSFSPFQAGWSSGNNSWDWKRTRIASGDFDGDGRDDLAVLYGYPSTRQAKIWVFKSDGNTYGEPVLWWDSGPNNWDWKGSKLVSGDFSGDLKDELSVFYNYKTTRQTKAWVFSSDGSKFNNPAMWWDSGPNNWDWEGSKLTTGDYNGDGRADIATLYGYQTTRQSKAWVFASNGNKFSSPAMWWDSGPNNWDWEGSKLTSGDYNGDGKTDIATLYGYRTTRQTKAWVFASNGNKFSSPAMWWDSGPNNWDWEGSLVLSGKNNADKYEDLTIIYGYEASLQTKTWVLRSSGTTFNWPELWLDSGPNSWEWNRTKATSGDINGDGLQDLYGLYNYGYR